MSTSAATPRIDFLLRRLVLVAGELHDVLAAGDWERAGAVQDEYDEAFATFQHRVDRGEQVTPALHNDFARLRHVHEENARMARELFAQAGAERGKVATISRIGAYAPIGTNEPGFASRYVDGSA